MDDTTDNTTDNAAGSGGDEASGHGSGGATTRAGASAYGSAREPEEWTTEDDAPANGSMAEERVDDPPAAEPAARTDDAARTDERAEPEAADADTERAADEQARREAEEESRRKAEEFAAEHDPANHDIAAGEEFRQDGDWTAEDTGGPQVWDSEGALVDGSGPGVAAAGDGGGRRVSALEEVRDGGYGIGSAAPIDDGAMPLGHPVKAWEDTKTFVTQDHPGYGDADPHVWFLDAAAAHNAGFSPTD